VHHSKKEITMRLYSVGLVGALVLAVFVAPLVAKKPPAARVVWIGWMATGPNPFIADFREAMRARGYAEGRNQLGLHIPPKLLALADEVIQ
jgi:hypothetical protein